MEYSSTTYRSFDNFTVMNILIVAFLVMLGHLTDGYWHCRGTCCPHFCPDDDVKTQNTTI